MDHTAEASQETNRTRGQSRGNYRGHARGNNRGYTRGNNRGNARGSVKGSTTSNTSGNTQILTSTTTLQSVGIKSSDPDFPFDLDTLDVRLQLPQDTTLSSTITVLNSDLPIHLRTSVEAAFAHRAQHNIPFLSPLGLLQWIERNLETLLSGKYQQSATVKFVRKFTTTISTTQSPIIEPIVSTSAILHCTSDQLQQRTFEITQLERRFRSSFQIKSSSTVTCDNDSTFNNIPSIIQIAFKPTDPDFPFVLDTVRLLITIPETYPSLDINSTSSLPTINILNGEFHIQLRTRVSERIKARCMLSPRPTLLHLLNWLDRHLELLLKDEKSGIVTIDTALSTPIKSSVIIQKPSSPSKETIALDIDNLHNSNELINIDHSMYGQRRLNEDSSTDCDSYIQSDTDSDSSSESSLSSIEETNDDETNNTEPNQSITVTAPLRGTQIRLPDIVLDNVALLECTKLSLLVRCTRCKNTNELCDLRPEEINSSKENDQSQLPGALRFRPGQFIRCNTCATTISCTFYSTLLHPTSLNLGTITTLSCTLSDVLFASSMSIFTPTCADCTTPFLDGFRGIDSLSHGQMVTITCRNCHKRMSVCVNTVRFIRIAGGGDGTDDLAAFMNDSTITHTHAKKKREREDAIVPGQPLPRDGSCKHYKQSYRWFRFPCCSRAYPCDVCHQEGSTLAGTLDRCGDSEVRARRMICGFCAKEQPMPPPHGDVTCSYCHVALNRRRTKGFWEGGKGTRDKSRMNSKDSKKYTNSLLKTKSNKSERVGNKKKKKTKQLT